MAGHAQWEKMLCLNHGGFGKGVFLVSIGVGGGMEVDGVASVAMGEAAGEAAVVLAWPVRMGNGLGSLG